MKTRIPIEIVVAVLAALSCLVALPQIGLPVWALFIAWAWYFNLGASPAVFKMVYPAAFAGAVLAAACIWLISIFVAFMPFMPAMMLAVFISVLLLMLVMKLPVTSCGLAAFNGYSCVFATYYGGFFRQTGSAEMDILMAFAFSIIANLIGPVFGYLSIYFTFPQQEEKKAKDVGM
ncbi:MAG TPA: DUF1097 domain-containing protein [Desulfotomaculum sp.]|nr:MAG: hypothetical protein VR67_07675 [Peptococcaceae bacterium BRH_c8a]KJS70913.1 MAG: hypothetical protein JL56_16245 [Desulfotomaculum sp. BICA1-6]KJS75376.1 MAG: hypothetical protein JL56_08035 [Desulfotomaculum sp. BICA1-6]HBX22192.1 DUF1097 domain-containing protein [Desulfotomaculum sp.]